MNRTRFKPVAPVIILKKEEPKEEPKEKPNEEPKEEEKPIKYIHPEQEVPYRNISIKPTRKKIMTTSNMNERLSTPFERIIWWNKS
jgi:hypothetical protein